KRVLAEMVERGGEPEALVASLGIEEVDADALDGILDEVLAAHPEEVARYREGKKNLIGFFLGQVMRKSGGQADPNAARKRLMTRLEA
ncbi:MAG: glutamine--tRNA ligase, partial [Myxococcales bacterium]|nr:glutamine--tRNA ligase [Myxococcales bacterium]